MNKIITIILFLFSSLCLMGQAELILVINSNGAPTYSNDDGSDPVKIIPGMTIPIAGNIFLPKESQVRIIVNQKAILLSGQGRYVVKDIYNSNTKKSMSFSSRFWKFVTAGMSTSSDRKDLENYHEQYMNIHGGIKGYTSEKNKIKLITPIYGKISSSSVDIDWIASDNNGNYMISVFDASKNLMHQVETPSNNYQLELEGLLEGEKYFFQIKAKNDKTKIETHFYFMPQEREAVLERLNYLGEYASSNQDEKKWMKAIVLEMEEYYYDTYHLYKQMINEDPDNLLLKKTFAHYLIRQDQLDNAQAILYNLK